VGEANEHDIPPHIYNFWIERLSIILTPQGLTRKEVSNSYKGFYKTRIGAKALKRLIDALCEAGLVYEDKDPNDKRFLMIYPLGGGDNNSKQVEDDLAEDLTDFMYTPDTPHEPPSTEISEAETEFKEDSSLLE